MAKCKIYLAKYDDGNGAFLTFCKDHEGARIASDAEKTLTALCEFLDMDAENENRHHLVGVHATLGKIVRKASNQDVAREVMLEIAESGGLHSMGH